MSASWITKLKESDSRLHKEDVIKQALEASTLGSTNASNFLMFTHICYNSYITLGVKKVPDKLFDQLGDAENPWEDFKDLLSALENRTLTGNQARQAIEEMSERFDMDNWNNFCAPVIRRDLRAGISLKTINKICKNTPFAIPVFGCQLATNSENRPEMRGEMRLEPKLDGVRVLMSIVPKMDGLAITCHSRNGKVFENFSHIEKQISRKFFDIVKKQRQLKNGFVLDGEVVGNSFQELMRQARRKENVHAEDSVFHVFDVLPVEDFQRGYWNAQLYKRVEILESLRGIINDYMPNVALVPYINLNLDDDGAEDKMLKYAQEQVASGYEGIMIKNVGAPYECKRNTFWMKWKPTITVDLQVVGVEEGTGRNKDRLGALVCAGVDFDKEIKVNVGSGFSDADRDNYWKDRQYIIGRTAEILCDSVSQNQDGTYSLRFPRFVRFRDDK